MGQIAPEDIKRLSNLEDAGIRGGIHSARTYLMALKDGSLWIWKQTGVEERDEIFVYELAKRMFRAIVPEVQPVFVPKLGWGSAMRKVAGVPAGRVDGLHGYFHGNDEMLADLVAMLVLDYMTGNPDRHSNNWFIMHNDRLAAIDNGWAGEDLAMSFADVFQPARLAGMMEDERLWPQLLKGIAVLIQDLEGRGDEVRALAEEIGIDKKEAVEMVRLWEPKLASMVKLIRSEAGRVEKARTYVESPEEVPPGAQMETGPRGGTYYETKNHGIIQEAFLGQWRQDLLTPIPAVISHVIAGRQSVRRAYKLRGQYATAADEDVRFGAARLQQQGISLKDVKQFIATENRKAREFFQNQRPTLYRGMVGLRRKIRNAQARGDTEVEITVPPLDSWTINREDAEHFALMAGEEKGVVVQYQPSLEELFSVSNYEDRHEVILMHRRALIRIPLQPVLFKTSEPVQSPV